MRCLLLFAYFAFLIEGVVHKCGACEQCKQPFIALRDLVLCRTSDVFEDDGQIKVNQEIATLFCQGKTVDEIIKEFKNIATRNAGYAAIQKMLKVLNPYKECLNKAGSNLDKAISQFTVAFKASFSKIIQNGVKAMQPYKAQCKSPAMYAAMGKYLCPLYTHPALQDVVDKTRAAQGAAAFNCAVKELKDVVFLKFYV